MKKFNTMLCAGLAAMLGACAGGGQDGHRAAEAKMMPTQGNTAYGSVIFRAEGERLHVSARMSGLTPGAHGFHIHERGDCSAPDAASAGGHYNPTAQPHGSPEHAAHHAGDLPLLVADANGNALLEYDLHGVTIGHGPIDLLGRAVVVHANVDDFVSQPAGNAGARVACGVISAK